MHSCKLPCSTLFDRQVGFEINEDKTQIYFAGSQETINYGALRHNPARLDAIVTSRDLTKGRKSSTGCACSTTWWCYGRFWCQQVDNHPTLGVAIRGLCSAPTFLRTPSLQLTAALKRHAEVLRLKVSRTTSQALRLK